MAFIQSNNPLDDEEETTGRTTTFNDAQFTSTIGYDNSNNAGQDVQAAPAHAIITSVAEPEPTQAPATTAAPVQQPSQPKQDVLSQPGVGAGTQSKQSAPYVFNNTDSNATKGSGFTNIKRYLEANQAGGQNLGTKVAGNLDVVGNTARSAVTALRDKAIANPLLDVNNSAEGAAAQKAIFEANEQANLANTEAGRAQLIRKLNPNVNLPGSNLNAFLMGASGGGQAVAGEQAELAPMQKAFGEFTGEISKSATAAQNALAEQKRAEAQAAYDAQVAADRAAAQAQAQAQLEAQQQFYAQQLAAQREAATQAQAAAQAQQQQYQTEQAAALQQRLDAQTASQAAQQAQQTQLIQQLQQQAIDAQNASRQQVAAQTAAQTQPVVGPTPQQVAPKIMQKATPEQAQTVIAEAQRRGAANGTTPESEVWKYAVQNGMSPEDIDAYFGWNQGASRQWAINNGFLTPQGQRIGYADGGHVNVTADIGHSIAGPVGAMIADAISAAITNSAGPEKAGYITGPGGPREDKIPAKLSDGEYVVPAHIVEKYGRDFFDQLLGENSPGVQRNK